MCTLSYDAWRHAQVPHELLLIVLLHFGFQGRQLLADFIVGFQIGEPLIERFLLTDAVAFRFRFHLIDTTFEGLKRAIASSSLLSS